VKQSFSIFAILAEFIKLPELAIAEDVIIVYKTLTTTANG